MGFVNREHFSSGAVWLGSCLARELFGSVAVLSIESTLARELFSSRALLARSLNRPRGLHSTTIRAELNCNGAKPPFIGAPAVPSLPARQNDTLVFTLF